MARPGVEQQAGVGARARARSCARVRDCSFGPGREYWRTTRADWPAVRSVQAELLARNPRAALVREVLETYPVPGKP